ncbi:hypothetical protein [Actinomyces procaprae]|uniref:hypothetical protein n=1 Tax=Actinomyces procaprae TaxID=2560010 RepID=UPI0010A22956
MTGLHHAGSYVLLDVPEAQAAADVDPRILLEGETPRLLDEWQTVPQVWNLARRAVDFSNQPGRFILTGSAVPTAGSVKAHRREPIHPYTSAHHDLGGEDR